jgi:hypothetical protein
MSIRAREADGKVCVMWNSVKKKNVDCNGDTEPTEFGKKQ